MNLNFRNKVKQISCPGCFKRAIEFYSWVPEAGYVTLSFSFLKILISLTSALEHRPAFIFFKSTNITMRNGDDNEDEFERPTAHTDHKEIRLGFFTVRSLWANIFFAFLAVGGQIGQGVSLPLWLAAGKSNTTSPNEREVDAYFVLSFASLFFVVAFGLIIVFVRLFSPHSLGKTEQSFPRRLLIAVGLYNGLNGAFTVFTSQPDRTAPYVQAILGNLMIPLIILARVIIVKKRPTMRKFICGMVVMLSLFISLLPSIFPKQLEPQKPEEQGEGASGIKGALWTLCFMIGFIPSALMSVVEEKALKMLNSISRRGVNIFYFLFWQSVYQLMLVMILFWVDIIPGFGFANSISQFGKNWWFCLRCFFGSAGCDSSHGIRGTVYILMYMVSYVGSGLLLRYAEGATLLAIVNSVVTPLCFLFWTLFKPEPSFKFEPEAHNSIYFCIGGLIIMIPAIYFYNTGPPEVNLQINRDSTLRHECPLELSEESPLINKDHWSYQD